VAAATLTWDRVVWPPTWWARAMLRVLVCFAEDARPSVRALQAGTEATDVGSRLPQIDRFTLRAAQRGDREAFNRIVDLYADRLRVLAFHLLHDTDLMDDALQDAFFNAYRGLPAFRGRSTLGTWLYRITYTVCMGYLRRRRAPAVNYDKAAECIAADADPADQLVTRSLVASALAALPPEQRAVVLLVDRDGFDYRAAAEVLNIPRGTVCSRLNVARAALREALVAAQATPAPVRCRSTNHRSRGMTALQDPCQPAARATDE
jgi:RNA polymerase sigma-70 factor, ECF subfamily